MAPPSKRACEASDSDEDYREGSDDDFQSARRSTRLRYRAAKQVRVSARLVAITEKRKEQEATQEAARLIMTSDNEAQPFLRLPGEIRNTFLPHVDALSVPYLPITLFSRYLAGM